MYVINLDQATLDLGAAAFRDYSAAVVCGPQSPGYDQGMSRPTGPTIIAGAVLACIERGICDEGAIVHAVARASRCRGSTVTTVVDGLCGADPSTKLWARSGGRLHALTPGRAPDHPPAMLLAA